MRARAAGAVALTLALVGCGASGTTPEESTSPTPEVTATVEPSLTTEGPHLITETIPAPSLADNLVGDPAEREIIVYLPPSYYTSDERYPVVYFLAGFTQRIGQFTQHVEDLWEQMQAEGMLEMIIVELDGIGALRGNFYTNSPVTGNASDFLTQDLVQYVDSTYRTIPEASARGLSGVSMGGSGTVNNGLSHPDVYAALYPHSPGILHEDNGLEEFLASNGAWQPYGAAFAWDLDAEPPYVSTIDPDVPLEQQDPEVVAAWESGYGDMRRKLDDYLAQPDRLVEIRVVWGTQDMYRWIPTGSAYLVDLLEEYDIPHSSRIYEGGHGLDYLYFESDFVEFFSRTLTA